MQCTPVCGRENDAGFRGRGRRGLTKMDLLAVAWFVVEMLGARVGCGCTSLWRGQLDAVVIRGTGTYNGGLDMTSIIRSTDHLFTRTPLAI